MMYAKVETVQRQQGESNMRECIEQPSGDGNRKQMPSVESQDKLRDWFDESKQEVSQLKKECCPFSLEDRQHEKLR